MNLQLLIVVLYFVLTIVIGIAASRKSHSSASFTGAQLGVLMCVAAGTGEWLGGTSTTGVSEYGYTFGISGAWYTIANGLGVIILALFFAKLYRSLDTVTVPGIIGKYLGPNCRSVSSVILVFVMLAVGTSQIIAAGTLGVSLLGLSFNTSVIVMGIGFIAYTILGGMVAVGYTNMLHLVVMYGGVIIALVAVHGQVGGWEGLVAQLPPEYLSPVNIGMPKVSSWVIASILGACTAQAGIQPLLAAKDVPTAKKAAIITAFIVAPFGIFTALLGMAAKALYPDLASGKLAISTLMMGLNPLVGGLVMASIMAAILSTVSPIILAAGTMLTKDLYQRARPGAGEEQINRTARLTTALSGVVCTLLAVLLSDSAMILDMVYFAYSLRGALFVVLLLAIFWKRTSPAGAIWGMLLTTGVGFFWIVYKSVTSQYPFHPAFSETYAAILAALLATVIVSVCQPLPQCPQPSLRKEEQL